MFHPPPFSSVEEQRLHTLCPVRALHVYVSRSAAFREGDQLLVSWATPHKGKPLSRQRLSHWIVEAISLTYGCRGLQPPQGLRAHSTCMATSWALVGAVSVRDICAAGTAAQVIQTTNNGMSEHRIFFPYTQSVHVHLMGLTVK